VQENEGKKEPVIRCLLLFRSPFCRKQKSTNTRTKTEGEREKHDNAIEVTKTAARIVSPETVEAGKTFFKVNRQSLNSLTSVSLSFQSQGYILQKTVEIERGKKDHFCCCSFSRKCGDVHYSSLS
jgi:hypothetical protein